MVLVAGAASDGIVLTRSEDGGATWQAPTILASSGSGLRLAAAGDRVVVSAQTPGGQMLWVSEDAGQTFTRFPMPGISEILGTGIDSANGDIWVATAAEDLAVRMSRDGGATFEGIIPIGTSDVPTSVAVGPRTVFAASAQPWLWAFPRDLSAARPIGGLLDGPLLPRVVVADDWDNAYVLETHQTLVQVSRLSAAATKFLPAKALAAQQRTLSAVALSDNALAVSLESGEQVFVAVETWP
jgi:hypothetical protein